MSGKIAQTPPGDERGEGSSAGLRKKILVRRTEKAENTSVNRRYTFLLVLPTTPTVQSFRNVEGTRMVISTSRSRVVAHSPCVLCASPDEQSYTV